MTWMLVLWMYEFCACLLKFFYNCCSFCVRIPSNDPLYAMRQGVPAGDADSGRGGDGGLLADAGRLCRRRAHRCGRAGGRRELGRSCCRPIRVRRGAAGGGRAGGRTRASCTCRPERLVFRTALIAGSPPLRVLPSSGAARPHWRRRLRVQRREHQAPCLIRRHELCLALPYEALSAAAVPAHMARA